MSDHRLVGSEEWQEARKSLADAKDRRFALGKEIAAAFADEGNYALVRPSNQRMDKARSSVAGPIDAGGVLSPSFVNAVDMAEVLASLTDAQLEAFWCFHNKGMTHPAIAKQMDRTEDAVRRLIGHALHKLTVRIQKGVRSSEDQA